MSLVTIDEARLRGVTLPADDGAAQDVIDEQEAWLARRIGPLTGERTERFYVGIGVTQGRLGLSRYTDSVDLTDGTAAVDPDHFRLIGRGSAVVLSASAPSRWWGGPYVIATYTPSDEDEVRGAIIELLGLASAPTSPYDSETIGSYSYTRGSGAQAAPARRAAIAAALLPKREALVILPIGRRLLGGDPVINRAEPVT